MLFDLLYHFQMVGNTGFASAIFFFTPTITSHFLLLEFPLEPFEFFERFSQLSKNQLQLVIADFFPLPAAKELAFQILDLPTKFFDEVIFFFELTLQSLNFA